jgi:hypothetical protein
MDTRLSIPRVLHALDDLVEAHHAGSEVLPHVDAFIAVVRDRYRELDADADPPYPVHNIPLERVLLALEDEIWQSEGPKPKKVARAAAVGAVRDDVIHQRRESAAGN